jgi:hypothetical protein
MVPYRDRNRQEPEMLSVRSSEELVLYGLLIAIGALPFGLPLARHAAFGVEATLGLLMVGTGVVRIIVDMYRVRKA